MAEENYAKKLGAGEHYGSVFHRHRIPSAFVSESVYPRSVSLPEHSHELGFFTLIIDGGYSEQIRRRDVVYSPQTVLWRQAEVSHRDRIEADSSRFFFVEIDAGYSEKIAQYGRLPERLAERSGTLTWLAHRLRSEIIDGECSSPLIAEGITLEMVGLLLKGGGRRETRPPKWLGRVVDRLDAEFAGGFSTDELAASAGVHPVYLASVFRRFYGETVGDYVQNRRVELAARLLSDHERPLVEIAFLCGFADQSHFSRVFKRRTGMTPGAYRSTLLQA